MINKKTIGKLAVMGLGFLIILGTLFFYGCIVFERGRR